MAVLGEAVAAAETTIRTTSATSDCNSTNLREHPRERLIFALDVPDLETARGWVRRLKPFVGVFKVGLQLFVAAGPAAIELVHEAGAQCFLDLKLHDIPETVSRASEAAARYGVRYLTVHAFGGSAMLRAAADAARNVPSHTTVLAITVLTSLDDSGLADLGVAGLVANTTDRLARIAIAANITGLVCSPHEAARLRALAPDAILVTPGIRVHTEPAGDQRRTASAANAIRSGADLVVVGRPIRDAADPESAARRVLGEIESALT